MSRHTEQLCLDSCCSSVHKEEAADRHSLKVMGPVGDHIDSLVNVLLHVGEQASEASKRLQENDNSTSGGDLSGLKPEADGRCHRIRCCSLPPRLVRNGCEVV